MLSSVMREQLKTELLTDPIGIGWSAMTATQIADAGNSAGINHPNRPVPIPSREVRRYLLIAGAWSAIKDDALIGSTPETRQACITLIDALDNFEDFDMSDAAVATAVNGALDALIATGHLDEATMGQKTAILALGNDKQSRAKELGLPYIRAGYVDAARA